MSIKTGYRLKLFYTKIRREEGVTLIEAALALILLGLFVMPILQGYTAKEIAESTHNTRSALSRVTDSINQYVVTSNGAYPCPADLRKKEGDISDYGKALSDCSFANVNSSVTNCNNPTWFASSGMCKINGPTADTILIGGVPFADIKLHPEDSLDHWGNKILYAVTYKQTDPATFTTDGGLIQAMTVESPLSPADGLPDLLSDRYDFILVSTGKTGIGGISKDGIRLTACKSPTINGYDNENCNFDEVFFLENNPSFKEASARSHATGVNFYDDFTKAQKSIPEEMWFPHNNNASYTNNKFILTMANRVGINTEDPQYAMHVNGSTRIESKTSVSPITGGWLKSDSICNEDESACFDPEIISGDIEDMQCDSDGNYYGNQGVLKLAFSKVTCNSGVYGTTDMSGNPTTPASRIGKPLNGEKIQLDNSIFDAINCRTTGKLATGIDLNGTLICTTP